jgi:hypothetical protein
VRIVPFAVLLSSCVAYRAAPVDLAQTARDLDARSVPEIDFAHAVGFAYAHSPDLQRLRAEARAAGLDVPPFGVAFGYDQHQAEWTALLDPVEIVQRGAAAKAARARQVEALAALREAERGLAAEVAECFLVEAALAERTLPVEAPDPQAFERAGLASEAAASQARGAREARAAEELAISAGRASNLARLRRLLGLAAGAPLRLSLPPAPFPSLPEPSRGRLLSRPDLAVALASYGVADAEFREAVRRQYPSLEIGAAYVDADGGSGAGHAAVTVDGAAWGILAQVRIPVGASKQARAAAERREAARHAVEQALLEAEEQATSREAAYRAAVARAKADAAEAEAMKREYAAASARLAVEGDAFGDAAWRAATAVAAAAGARESEVAAARARVAYAAAYGWPRPEEVR